MDQLTREGIDALRLGERETGRGLLERAVAANPDNAVAHLWLASIGRDKEQQRRQAKRASLPEPHQSFTSRDLHELDGVPRQPYRRSFELLDRNTLHTQQTAKPAAPSVAAGGRAAKQAVSAPGAAPSESPPAAGPPVPDGGPADSAPTPDSSTSPTAAPPLAGDASTASQPPPPAGHAPSEPPVSVSPQPGASEMPGQSPDTTAAANGPLADDLIAVAPVDSTAAASGEASAPPSAGAVEPVLQPDTGSVVAPGTQSAGQSRPRRRPWVLVTLLLGAALCATVLVAALTRDLRQAQNAAGAEERTPLATTVTSGVTAARPATIYSSWGTFMVPGTAYVDVTEQIRAAKVRSVVPVWPEPFNTSGTSTCAVPHGSAVQILDTVTNAEGARSFKIRLRDCGGWIDDGLLKDTAVAPVDPADVQVPTAR